MEGISDDVQRLALIFARILGLFFSAPIFSSETIRYRMRITLALLLSFVIYPITANSLAPLPNSPQVYALEIFSQLILGLTIGFLILIVFSSFQIIGEIFSLQIGLSFSEVLDPQSQISLPLLGILKNAIGILIFLAVPFQMDGEYMPAFLHMLRALTHSFQAVPSLILSEQIQGGILKYVDQAFGMMFLTALKIGVPLIGILFITSLTLGLLGKAAPQMNLISMGIQINIAVGMIVLLLLIPVIVPLMSDAFIRLYDQMGDMFRSWP